RCGFIGQSVLTDTMFLHYGGFPYEGDFPAFNLVRYRKLAHPQPARLKIKLALFEEGLWCASFDGQETRTIPFTATSDQVANALNEVPAIRAAGGVTVYGSLLVSTTPAVDNSFFVTWNFDGPRGLLDARITTANPGLRLT